MAGKSSFNFAHLISGARARTKAQQEDEDKKPASEEEDEEELEEEDEEEQAEDEEEEEEAEEDEEEEAEEEEEEEAAAANAKALRKARRAGVARERKRWGAILSSPAAKNRVALAATLAAGTDLGAAQVIAMLESSPIDNKGQLGAKMRAAAQPQLGTGGDGGGDADEASSLAAEVLKAGEAVRGTPRRR